MLRTILIVIILSITACSTTNPEEAFTPGSFQTEDLSFYESKDNHKIGLGMAREEIEKKLGKPIGTIDFLGISEYVGIKVHFNKDNIVNALMVDDNTESNNKYSTPRGLRYGESIDSIIKKYGEPSNIDKSNNNTSLTYLIEESSGRIVGRSSLDQIQNRDKAYTISMNITNEHGMTFIMIADFEYSFNPTGK